MNDKVVSREYSVAATEILEILNHLPKEMTNKIPAQLIIFFQKISIEDYKPQFDYSQGIGKIGFSDKTRALLAMIYRNYLCSEQEKKEYEKVLFENEEKFQRKLREQYNPDAIFERNWEVNIKPQTELVEYKEKWYQKILRKIVGFFKR